VVCDAISIATEFMVRCWKGPTCGLERGMPLDHTHARLMGTNGILESKILTNPEHYAVSSHNPVGAP
jgi:hypothetical protein